MKKVAFYQPFMNERGTCVAMFDYAYYNETLLKNKSLFIYDSKDIRNEPNSLKRIMDNFETHDINCSNYDNDNANNRVNKIDEVLEKTKSTHIYLCKSGFNDGVIPTKAKSLVHIMGMINPKEKHCDVWAYVSYFSNNACANGKEIVLPYMVNLPDIHQNLREQLNIPKDAIVIGRHGGIDTFDIPWAHKAVLNAVNNRPNLYFVFLNTPVFVQHPRIIFLGKILDLNTKTMFINTCDAMLHARDVGETFGMACAEFSSRNKPVMTYGASREKNHIEILGNKGLYYNNENELLNLLMTFSINNDIDWNCYKDYTPEKIMKIFDKIFLQ
jgi:hypothetical protein